MGDGTQTVAAVVLTDAPMGSTAESPSAATGLLHGYGIANGEENLVATGRGRVGQCHAVGGGGGRDNSAAAWFTLSRWPLASVTMMGSKMDCSTASESWNSIWRRPASESRRSRSRMERRFNSAAITPELSRAAKVERCSRFLRNFAGIAGQCAKRSQYHEYGGNGYGDGYRC